MNTPLERTRTVIQIKDFLMALITDLDLPKKVLEELKCLFRQVPAAVKSGAINGQHRCNLLVR